MLLALRSLYESSGPPAVTGTGAVTLALTIAATGQQAHSGTGAISLAPTIAASGQQQHVGTGALALAPTIAATGQQKHLGTGAISLALSVTADGSVVAGGAITGTGDLTLSANIAAEGQQAHSGTGDLIITVGLDATGDVGAPTVIGTAEVSLDLVVLADGTVVNPEPEVGTYSPGGASSSRTRVPKTRYGLSPWEVQHDEQAAEVATPEPALPGRAEPLGKPTRIVPIEAEPWETPEPVSIPAVSAHAIDALLGIPLPDDDEEAILLLLEQL